MPKEYATEIALDNEVLFVIFQHKGGGNAIMRWALVEKIFGADAVIEPMRNNNNPYDRQVRDSIERWRSQGQHICNVGEGYFIAQTRAEYEKFKHSYLSAVYRKLEITSMMDATADKKWGAVPKPASQAQVSMFG